MIIVSFGCLYVVGLCLCVCCVLITLLVGAVVQALWQNVGRYLLGRRLLLSVEYELTFLAYGRQYKILNTYVTWVTFATLARNAVGDCGCMDGGRKTLHIPLSAVIITQQQTMN